MRRIRIEAEDDCGNRSALEFTVRGRSESFRAEADTAAVALYPDRTSLVQVGREARTSIPEGALYEPIFVKPERRETPQADSGVVVLSPAYRFLSPDTPLRHPAAVTVRTRVPRRLQFRTALAVRNRKGRLAWVGGSLCERHRDGLDLRHGRPGRGGRHARTRGPAPLRRRRRPLEIRKPAFPRRRQFLGHRLVDAAHRRRMGPLRPVPREGHARPTFFDAPPQRRRHDVQLSVRTDAAIRHTSRAHFTGNAQGIVKKIAIFAIIVTLSEMSDNNTSERKPLILIAEDVESNYKLLEIILKKESTICCGPKTAKEAVEYAFAEHPDAVLMDIKMPVMDGIEALKEIRLRTTNCPSSCRRPMPSTPTGAPPRRPDATDSSPSPSCRAN